MTVAVTSRGVRTTMLTIWNPMSILSDMVYYPRYSEKPLSQEPSIWEFPKLRALTKNPNTWATILNTPRKRTANS